ncbi:DNA translocase FtsK 4TM domain-containing protein, partial [bacterium]|nr:DNA translocase FtsK 4TM domain-containing protein [bacterium]
MTKRKPASGRGNGRSRAATSTKSRGTQKKTATKPKKDRPPRFAGLRERIRRGFGRHADDLWGIFLVTVGVLVILAFFDLAGPVGGWITSGLRIAFGVWAYVVAGALVVAGAGLIVSRPRTDYGRIASGFIITFFGSLALFHLMTGSLSLSENLDLIKQRGGGAGSLIAFPLHRLLGFWGAFTVLVGITALGVLVLTRTTIREVGMAISAGLKASWGWIRGRNRRTGPEVVTSRPMSQPRMVAAPPQQPEPAPAPAKKAARSKKQPAPAQMPVGQGYQLPPLELLAMGGGADHSKRLLDDTARTLEETLIQHGVDARLTRIVPGPTVTRYEIELAPGVKVAKVTGLAHDIAYALATPDVRLLAPIPGKSAIGVEVPNRRRRLVTLGDILRSPEAKEADHPLQVALGMDISGKAQMLHIGELPHVLIAGATGAGKSSCINALVTSILMRTTPDEVRLILVDPKRVELGQYNDVPHLLTRVITNPKKAADALQWAVSEMDRRYDLLADAGVRDIDGYQERWDSGALDTDRFDRFPFIVVVVDELNDLMMVAGRTVEDAIVRVAQMARAVGIHLVIATQR